jgi:signal transduction histidine kinase/ActR/RegA family two-component response regulator
MRRAKVRRFRDLSTGLGAMTLAALAVGTVVWINIDHIQAASARVGEASTELSWAAAAMDAVDDQDNAVEGLISTRDARFLGPYNVGRGRLDHALAELAQYAADDGRPERRDVSEARQLVARWSQTVAAPAAAAVEAGRAPHVAPARTRTEIKTIKHDIDDLQDLQNEVLARRDRALSSAYGSSRVALVLGVVASLVFTLAILGRTYQQLLGERRLAEREAERLAQALDGSMAAERAKTRFLANMSHEMRTPLNGVSGMAGALAGTRLDRRQRELVDAIGFSATTLDHLIGDLLSLARDGEMARQPRPSVRFHLGAAARATTAGFAQAAAAKGLALQVEIAPETEIEVTGDTSALGQLLSCLLSNAVKFTERGEVRLGLSPAGPDRYAFQVYDTGAGFDEATQAQLFELFAQSDDGDTRRHGGAGVGLPLAARLAEAMGGTLEAHSAPGVGSTFTFVAPFARAEPDAGAAPHDQDHRVLIVDDSEMNRRVLETILDQIGIAWASACNGREAVEAARQEAFAAILMDIQMPVMDGLTATRRIRQIERELGRIPAPVIVVSANCQPEHVDAGVAAGAQRHIAKPVSVPALLGALNDVLADTPMAA